MVSRKCTCQLSLVLTLPIDAAMPPSAITVCALPNSDLQMIAVRLPCCAGLDRGAQPGAAGADDDDVVVVAARCLSVVSVVGHRGRSVDEPQVGDPAGRHRHDVEVGERQR